MNINLDSWHALLQFLRHLELNFDWNPIKSGKSYDPSVTPNHYRCIILDQFRQCASVLEYLTLYWSDIRLLLKHSSSPWPFVRQLNILMESCTNIPSASLIKRLPTNKAFPQLQYLSFGGRRFSLTPPKPLAIRILLCFDALVSSSSKFIMLHMNKCCGIHRSLPFTSRDILLTILTERVRSRSDHYSSSKIIIDSNEERFLVPYWKIAKQLTQKSLIVTNGRDLNSTKFSIIKIGIRYSTHRLTLSVTVYACKFEWQMSLVDVCRQRLMFIVKNNSPLFAKEQKDMGDLQIDLLNLDAEKQSIAWYALQEPNTSGGGIIKIKYDTLESNE
ncbi:unnamed protein product [Rotaria sp. Silwood1]|nr:unnamed protein product [Rotaria sp. Silwood1]